MKIAVATSTQTLCKHYQRLLIKKYVRRKTSRTDDDDDAVDISAHEREKKKEKTNLCRMNKQNRQPNGAKTHKKLTAFEQIYT